MSAPSTQVRGERIILTRSDPDAGGVHHSIPCGWIESVDDKVVLNIDAEEAKRRWQTDNRSRALFEREHKACPARTSSTAASPEPIPTRNEPIGGLSSRSAGPRPATTHPAGPFL